VPHVQTLGGIVTFCSVPRLGDLELLNSGPLDNNLPKVLK
jgi:hypothetical protein